MNIASSVTKPKSLFALNPFAWRKWWLQIDKDTQVLSWAQTYIGQVVLHILFFGLVFTVPIISFKYLALVFLALALCAIFPTRRLLMLCSVATLYFVLRPFKSDIAYARFPEILESIGADALPTQVGISAFGIFLILAVIGMGELQRNGVKAFPVRRPILSMFILITVLTAVTALLPQATPLSSLSWVILTFLSSAFFFIAYIFLDNRGKSHIPIYQKVGFIRPIWTIGFIPMKGPNYIKKYEAKDDLALATTRLKAVKLLLWSAILYWIWELCFNQFLFDHLAFTRLEEAMVLVATGQAQNIVFNWVVLITYFMAELFALAFYTHLFVAIVRMAGFQIPRGMVNPLASRSISEFWGRYLFYFKEMLADIFFFPTFQRFFKKSPKLRLAFATFIAAFVGNILFDFIPVLPSIAVNGVVDTVDNYYSYTFYAALLTVGLIISQLWFKIPKPEDGYLRYNILPRVQVIGFFVILQVFDDSTGIIPLESRIEFFLSLFGVYL